MSAVSIISRDITQRKEDEAAARHQELRLLQSEKMASLGILVSGVAHEINTPNNYISLNAKIVSRAWNDIEPILREHYEVSGDFLLAQMPYSQTKEKIDRLVSGISEGADRIQKIVQALKNFARKDTGDLNQTVDVNAVIRTSLVIMNSFIKQSTDFFSVEYGQNLFPVHGNAQQLEQVIINLITNACEALPGKEKKITVSTRLFTKTNKIVIEVQDEGMGISSEDLQFIFDPFFTTKRASGGIGLGLSTSHTIVRNHGGEFLFQSKPGKGTTARVILPVKPSHAIRN
jgi:polar amino acid transport system substrate-binding protein